MAAVNLTPKAKVFVPKRPSIVCPVCGKESYQRLAEDGESILLIGKGQRFNVRAGEIRWNCRECGAEHTMILFGKSMSYEPKIKSEKKEKKNLEK